MSVPPKSSDLSTGGSAYPLSSNLLRSLTSVHLPPPPATGNHPVVSTSLDPEHEHRRSQRHAASMNGTFFREVQETAYATPWSGQNSKTMSMDEFHPNAAAAAAAALAIGGSPLEARRNAGKGASLFGDSHHPILGELDNGALNTPPSSQPRANSGLPRAFTSHDEKYDMASPTLGGHRSTRYREQNKENIHPSLMTPHARNTGYQRKPLPFTAPQRFLDSQAPIMSKISRVEEKEEFIIPEPSEMPSIVDDGGKPPYSYASLIGMAILRSPERKLTLAQIYQWINDSFKWYRQTNSGWQNSIRHNLSLNKAFTKQERPKNDPGKGHYWVVVPGSEYQFVKSKAVRRSTTNTNMPPQGTSHIQSRLQMSRNTQQIRAITAPTAANTEQSTDEEDNSGDEREAKPTSLQQHETNNSNGNNVNEINIFTAGQRKRTFNDIEETSDNDDLFNSPIMIKRTKTAIGLQHFMTTNISAESPTPKAPGQSDLLLNRISPIKMPFGNTKTPDRKDSVPMKLMRSQHRNSTAALDPDEIPNLSAPPSSWLMGTSSDGSFAKYPRGNDPTLSTDMTGSTILMSPVVFGSPSSSLRQHRAAVKSLTVPLHDYEDLLSSPSASLGKQRVVNEEEEDDASRVCFGSPDKRDARRRQFFESWGVPSLHRNEELVDVFGVDVCQVMRRALAARHQDVEHAGEKEEKPEASKSWMDSPIKTQDGISPPKVLRRDSAYF